MLKTIIITIPEHENVPEIINSFSPEENLVMLKIGSDCLREGRKVVSNFTQKEIYNKLKEETKKEVQSLELNILVERETAKKMEEKIGIMYENQLSQMKKQIETMRDQIINYEYQNEDKINAIVEKTKEKYDLLLEEKDRQVTKLSDIYEKLLIQTQTQKSNSHKGSDGEKQFCEYAETFMDFQGFEIIDKHTQGGEGDFHLHFEEFGILVDAKNYKKKIPIDQREKIKKDLIKNEHLNFAWLVSLNSTIDKFDKSPIMYEWVNTTQCIVYINNLSGFEDPKKILRIVWFTCKELYKFVEDVNFDETELNELKNQNFKLMDKIKNVRKTIREINKSMNATKNLIQVMDDELRIILENETNEIVTSNFSLFDAWWDENIETTKDETFLVSTDLWIKFKQDNKTVMKDFDISTDKFKQYIKSKVSLSSINLKSKHTNCAFEIKGICFKQVVKKEFPKNQLVENEILSKNQLVEIEILPKNQLVEIPKPVIKKNMSIKIKKGEQNLNLDLELENDKIIKINNKIVKPKIENYFDVELDNKILQDYNEDEYDIINLAEKYNVKTWEIVSLLMRYKVINKRILSKGYDKYKESDEYKEKIQKKPETTI